MVAVIDAKESPYAIANDVLEVGVNAFDGVHQLEILTKGIVGCRLCTAQG